MVLTVCGHPVQGCGAQPPPPPSHWTISPNRSSLSNAFRPPFHGSWSSPLCLSECPGSAPASSGRNCSPGGGGDWLGTRRTLDGRGHVSPHSCPSPGPPSDLPGTHFPSGQMNSWTRWTPQVLLVLSSCTFRSTFNLPLLGGGPVLFEVNPGGS